jgi:beta-barrel assembly-enhancing protease
MKSLVVVLVLAAPLAGQQNSAAGLNFYSLDREIAEGRKVAAELAGSLPMMHDERLDAWMERLGRSLAPSPYQSFTHPVTLFRYSFTLFDDRTPAPARIALTMPFDAAGAATEPIAVAGGGVYVPASLLANAPNETIFAFQLAHAIAHIALRHPTRMATRAEVVGNLPPPFVGDWPANGALGLPAFAQTLEQQADDLAVELVSAAGYDPAAVVPYLEPQRAGRVRASSEKLPPRDYRANTGQFEAMKALAVR